jgi:nucleolar protein 56
MVGLDLPVIYETEFGYIVIRENDILSSYRNFEDLLDSEKFEGKVYASSESLRSRLISNGIDALLSPERDVKELETRMIELLVKSGLFGSYEEAFAALREKTIKKAEKEVMEESSRPDLHLSNAIQALDETDKYLNVITARVREWYGLHFPELDNLINDNITYCKIVEKFGKRSNISKDGLLESGFSEKKAEAVVTTSENSKGGVLSDEDAERIISLASLAIRLSKERENLSEYVDRVMGKIAPNVKNVVGSTIGARLIAKAGGLQRLATMPSSTIQILGAEKALFRALRTGGKPPKHGIIFQHQDVHSSPRWQRGKIARTIANKVAIAARIDVYGGELNQELLSSLKKNIDRIKEIYSKPKQKEKEKHGKNNNKRGRRKS